MANSEAYKTVIADLRRQRDEIDAMIKRLTAMAGGDLIPAGGTTQDANALPELPSTGKNPYLGMKVADAAKVVLQQQREMMSPADITTRLENGGLPVASSKTVASVLHRRSKEIGDIVSPKRGYWGLKEWYPNRTFGSRDNDKDEGASSTSEPEQPGAPPRIVPLPSSDQP